MLCHPHEEEHLGESEPSAMNYSTRLPQGDLPWQMPCSHSCCQKVEEVLWEEISIMLLLSISTCLVSGKIMLNCRCKLNQLWSMVYLLEVVVPLHVINSLQKLSKGSTPPSLAVCLAI